MTKLILLLSVFLDIYIPYIHDEGAHTCFTYLNIFGLYQELFRKLKIYTTLLYLYIIETNVYINIIIYIYTRVV